MCGASTGSSLPTVKRADFVATTCPRCDGAAFAVEVDLLPNGEYVVFVEMPSQYQPFRASVEAGRFAGAGAAFERHQRAVEHAIDLDGRVAATYGKLDDRRR